MKYYSWKETAVLWFSLGTLFGIIMAFASCTPAEADYHRMPSTGVSQ